MDENKVNSYKDLIVWQKSIELVIDIYRITDSYPKSELYGLVSQMRRSSVSIATNIAEGRRRGTRKDYKNFLNISFGSGAELETLIIISKRMIFSKKINFTKADNLLEEIMKMLNRMILNLQATS